MPAIALVLRPVSVVPSVAGAAVALLVALLEALLFDTDVVVAILVDVASKDEVLPDTALETRPVDATDVPKLLALLTISGAVSVSDD